MDTCLLVVVEELVDGMGLRVCLVSTAAGCLWLEKPQWDSARYGYICMDVLESKLDANDLWTNFFSHSFSWACLRYKEQRIMITKASVQTFSLLR